ncbi:MAG: transcription termination factor Rho [Thermoguttaceae bacterium]|nr:transcription termination factor Rho [Thermoguttaceae bacterium]
MLLQDATVGRLQQLSIQELIAEARRFEIGIPDEDSVRKQDLIFSIIKEKIKLNGLLYGEGTLEILPDGFGFLRSTEYNYLSCPDDIYVSPSQIRRFGLRNGSCVSGQIRPPKENERYFALLRVEAINFRDPNEFRHRKLFEELTPMHPTYPMKLECGEKEIETRVLDLVSPIGFGQRGLIVGPEGSGKTTLLTKIASAALKNYPDLYVFLLSVDEKSEEVEALRNQLKGLNCEVVSSTTDEPALRHIQVADMVLEKAKRMVEFGQNVLILIDSLTSLARVWHLEGQMGHPMDVAFNGMIQSPRGFLTAARALEEGGSLTILAALTNETEDPLENAIYEEFKGTGNLEIVLDQRLAEQKVWPAIDVNQSGTHREEMLRTPDEFQAITKLRSFLADLNPVSAMEMLTKRLGKTPNNEEFLKSM